MWMPHDGIWLQHTKFDVQDSCLHIQRQPTSLFIDLGIMCQIIGLCSSEHHEKLKSHWRLRFMILTYLCAWGIPGVKEACFIFSWWPITKQNKLIWKLVAWGSYCDNQTSFTSQGIPFSNDMLSIINSDPLDSAVFQGFKMTAFPIHTWTHWILNWRPVSCLSILFICCLSPHKGLKTGDS